MKLNEVCRCLVVSILLAVSQATQAGVLATPTAIQENRKSASSLALRGGHEAASSQHSHHKISVLQASETTHLRKGRAVKRHGEIATSQSSVKRRSNFTRGAIRRKMQIELGRCRRKKFIWYMRIRAKCHKGFGKESKWDRSKMGGQCKSAFMNCQTGFWSVCCSQPKGPDTLDAFCEKEEKDNQIKNRQGQKQDEACKVDKMVQSVKKDMSAIKQTVKLLDTGDKAQNLAIAVPSPATAAPTTTMASTTEATTEAEETTTTAATTVTSQTTAASMVAPSPAAAVPAAMQSTDQALSGGASIVDSLVPAAPSPATAPAADKLAMASTCNHLAALSKDVNKKIGNIQSWAKDEGMTDLPGEEGNKPAVGKKDIEESDPDLAISVRGVLKIGQKLNAMGSHFCVTERVSRKGKGKGKQAAAIKNDEDEQTLQMSPMDFDLDMDSGKSKDADKDEGTDKDEEEDKDEGTDADKKKDKKGGKDKDEEDQKEDEDEKDQKDGDDEEDDDSEAKDSKKKASRKQKEKEDLERDLNWNPFTDEPAPDHQVKLSKEKSHSDSEADDDDDSDSDDEARGADDREEEEDEDENDDDYEEDEIVVNSSAIFSLLDFDGELSEAVGKFETGVHPHGFKWWRYRYEYTIIESFVLAYSTFLMYLLQWLVFGLSYKSDRWHRTGITFTNYKYPTQYFIHKAATTCIMVCIAYFMYMPWGDVNPFNFFAEAFHSLVDDAFRVPLLGYSWLYLVLDIQFQLFVMFSLYSLFICCVTRNFNKALEDWKNLDMGEKAKFKVNEDLFQRLLDCMKMRVRKFSKVRDQFITAKLYIKGVQELEEKANAGQDTESRTPRSSRGKEEESWELFKLHVYLTDALGRALQALVEVSVLTNAMLVACALVVALLAHTFQLAFMYFLPFFVVFGFLILGSGFFISRHFIKLSEDVKHDRESKLVTITTYCRAVQIIVYCIFYSFARLLLSQDIFVHYPRTYIAALISLVIVFAVLGAVGGELLKEALCGLSFIPHIGVKKFEKTLEATRLWHTKVLCQECGTTQESLPDAASKKWAGNEK